MASRQELQDNSRNISRIVSQMCSYERMALHCRNRSIAGANHGHADLGSFQKLAADVFWYGFIVLKNVCLNRSFD